MSEIRDAINAYLVKMNPLTKKFALVFSGVTGVKKCVTDSTMFLIDSNAVASMTDEQLSALFEKRNGEYKTVRKVAYTVAENLKKAGFSNYAAKPLKKAYTDFEKSNLSGNTIAWSIEDHISVKFGYTHITTKNVKELLTDEERSDYTVPDIMVVENGEKYYIEVKGMAGRMTAKE